MVSTTKVSSGGKHGKPIRDNTRIFFFALNNIAKKKNRKKIAILIYPCLKLINTPIPAMKEMSEFDKNLIGILNKIRFRKRNIFLKKLSMDIGE